MESPRKSGTDGQDTGLHLKDSGKTSMFVQECLAAVRLGTAPPDFTHVTLIRSDGKTICITREQAMEQIKAIRFGLELAGVVARAAESLPTTS